MSENLDERTLSDGNESDVINDDLEFDDPRIHFILNYLNLIFGTNPNGLKKGTD